MLLIPQAPAAAHFLGICLALVLLRYAAAASDAESLEEKHDVLSAMAVALAENWRIWVAGVCGAAAATLSSAGGLGGGGLYVPIFNLLLQFDSKTSAALSSCTIVGGIVVNVTWYAFQTKPTSSSAAPKKPLIDYQIALLCLPNLLLGISVGVIFNVMSPGWLVTATLVVVLTFMTTRSCLNAIRRWARESDSNHVRYVDVVQQGDIINHVNGLPKAGIINASPSGDAIPAEQHESIVINHDDLGRPLLINNSSDRIKSGNVSIHGRFPAVEILLLTVIWVAFLALQVLRGSSDGQNLFNIETCGTVYWMVTSMQLPLAILFSVCAILYLGRGGRRKSTTEEEGIPPPQQSSEDDDGDTVYGAYIADAKSMTKLSGLALASGVLGGMLGLGGGMIISPLFIDMGMHPQVTAATCSFMVFFSSSLSVIQYWLLGRIPEEYALISALISLVFSIIGLQLVQSFIVRYGRDSLIVFCVSTVMGISAILMAGFGSWDVWIQIKEGDYMGFELPC